MTKAVTLGEITCPSGELVLMDGGYLCLWSGDRAPEQQRPEDLPSAVDFEIVGTHAEEAARSFDRQAGRTLYDIPERQAVEFTTAFDEHCREHRYAAALRRFDGQVPHRERVRRAVAGGDPGFLISGVPVIVVGGVPTDRPMRVVASPDEEWGWRHIRIEAGAGTVARRRELDRIGIDSARFVFADAGALSAWVHEDAIDGMADVVLWGRDEDAVATEFGASRVGGDGFGWINVPVREAYEKAVALDAYRNSSAGRRFAFDFRPHSHHWQVMAGVRAAEHEAATIHVGGADIMFAMTSVGDGFFPAHVETDRHGELVAIQITIESA